jgi:hypothetical protein
MEKKTLTITKREIKKIKKINVDQDIQSHKIRHSPKCVR